MSLPPLANFLAVRRDDPREADGLERAFRADDRFREVRRPAPGWVVGIAPLPGGTADPAPVSEAGLVFAEGRDAVRPSKAEGAGAVAGQARQDPERLALLPGDFTFLAFDAGGEVTAVRSAAGLAPLYVADGGRVLTTRLKWTVPYLPGGPRLDPLSTGLWTWGWPICPDGRAPLEGVRLIPRGRFARVGANGVREAAYWDPRPDRLPLPGPDVRREHAERLRAVLLERLETDLDPSGGNWLTYSGGVDSTSLRALSAGTLGLPVSAVTLAPTEPLWLERERALWRMLADRAPLRRHHTFPLTEPALLANARRAPLSGFPCPHPVLQEVLRLAADEAADVRVVFGGEFGDEVGGSYLNLPDWVTLLSLPRMLGRARRLPHGPTDLLRWAKWRAQAALGRPHLPFPSTFPDYLNPEAGREYAEWSDRIRRTVMADARPLRYLALRAELLDFVPMNWEACSELGVRRSVPFVNRAALELAFDCHPDELIGPGFRRLTRDALRHDVPAAALVPKPQWGEPPGSPVAWDRPLPATLAPVLPSDWIPLPPAPLPPHVARRMWHLLRFAESVGLAPANEAALPIHIEGPC